MEITLRLV